MNTNALPAHLLLRLHLENTLTGYDRPEWMVVPLDATFVQRLERARLAASAGADTGGGCMQAPLNVEVRFLESVQGLDGAVGAGQTTRIASPDGEPIENVLPVDRDDFNAATRDPEAETQPWDAEEPASFNEAKFDIGEMHLEVRSKSFAFKFPCAESADELWAEVAYDAVPGLPEAMQQARADAARALLRQIEPHADQTIEAPGEGARVFEGLVTVDMTMSARVRVRCDDAAPDAIRDDMLRAAHQSFPNGFTVDENSRRVGDFYLGDEESAYEEVTGEGAGDASGQEAPRQRG